MVARYSPRADGSSIPLILLRRLRRRLGGILASRALASGGNVREPRTTIAIVPRERFSATRPSLENVLAATPEPRRLVYIDGGSPAPVARYLEDAARRHDILLLRSDCFLTPNQARNIALA